MSMSPPHKKRAVASSTASRPEHQPSTPSCPAASPDSKMPTPTQASTAEPRSATIQVPSIFDFSRWTQAAAAMASQEVPQLPRRKKVTFTEVASVKHYKVAHDDYGHYHDAYTMTERPVQSSSNGDADDEDMADAAEPQKDATEDDKMKTD